MDVRSRRRSAKLRLQFPELRVLFNSITRLPPATSGLARRPLRGVRRMRSAWHLGNCGRGLLGAAGPRVIQAVAYFQLLQIFIRFAILLFVHRHLVTGVIRRHDFIERNPAPLRADRAGDLVRIVADVLLAGLNIPLANRCGDKTPGCSSKDSQACTIPSRAREWIGQPSTARKVMLAFLGLTAGAFGSVAALGGGGCLSSRLRASGLNGMTTPIMELLVGRGSAIKSGLARGPAVSTTLP